MNSSGTTIAVVGSCLVLLAVGLVLTARWYAIPLAPPPRATDQRAMTAALRCLWWITLGVSAGAATGILVIGAGGRLAMRLLAVTAGDDAQGRLTDADEIVGDISVDGTLAFMLFVGLFGGLLTGVLYIAIHRWLPGGRWRGLWYGGVLLVGLATRIEPLRTSNEDFDIVGPAWVSLLVFGALALAQGAAVAAFVARWGRTQPLLTTPRAALRYLPLVPFLLFIPFTVILIVLVLVSVVFARFRIADRFASPRVDVIGRVALVLLVVAAVPGFVAAVADIADRSP